MKIIITCNACYNQMKIPNDKHIRFRCSDETCKKLYEYKNGKRVKRKIIFPILAIALFVFGLFDSIFFPTPLILGTTWFIWWFFKRSNNYLKKFLFNLSLTTGIAFSVLLIFQLLVNIFLRPDNLEIPKWLLVVDDYTLWIRSNLEIWTSMSFLLFLLILVTLFIITYIRPNRKYISKFLKIDTFIGRAFFVCLIITSFTFFSPIALESVTQDSFYKYYKIAYREKSKQERKELLANELLKRLESEDYQELLSHAYPFEVNFFIPELTNSRVEEESEKDIRDIMSSSGISKWRLLSATWSEERLKESGLIEKSWNQKIDNFETNLNSSVKTAKSAERNTTEQIINQSIKAKILSEEAVSALSAIFSRFCGELTPEMNKLVNQYISSILINASNYFFDQSRIERVVTNFFNRESKSNKFNLFSKLRYWKTNEQARLKDLEQKRSDLIAERKEKKRREENKLRNQKRLLLQEENFALLESIEKQINSLEFKATPGDETFFSQNLQPIIGDDVAVNKITSAYRADLLNRIKQINIVENSMIANNQLQQVSRILSISTSILNFFVNIRSIMPSSFKICKECGRPISAPLCTPIR